MAKRGPYWFGIGRGEPYWFGTGKIEPYDFGFLKFMSYASYDIECHIVTNDAYDIKILNKSIWSIFVLKIDTSDILSLYKF